jgi:hypothetical protein
MATKTKANVLMFAVNESTKRAVDVAPMDYQELVTIGNATGHAEHNLLMMVFAKQPTPTFKDYQEWRKASKLPHVTSKTKGERATFLMFNNIAKIQEAQEAGFDALAHWNTIALTKKRETEPTIQGGILQGARDFLNGAKETDYFAEFAKGIKRAYKMAIELPNNKANAQRVAKLEAIALADGITLASETEADES